MESTGGQCEPRRRGDTCEAPQYLLNFFPPLHGHASLRPIFGLVTLACDDTSFRLLTEFGRPTFTSLLFADIVHGSRIPSALTDRRASTGREPSACKYSWLPV
jgi:hypothetical protein